MAKYGWYRGRNVFRPFFVGRRAYFFARSRRSEKKISHKGEYSDMKELMQKLRDAASEAIEKAEDVDALEALRVKYLGKKGELTAILKQMGQLSAEERPVMGQMANQLRAELEEKLDERKSDLAEKMLDMKMRAEAVDVTVPGTEVELGHKHPMYNVLDQIKDIFIGMGFEILDGPEVELSEYNFTKLNTPEDHPAREWSDTFYLTDDSSILLRTQTSNMQIRAMETRPLPIRMLAPGRVYRKDEVDATHSPMFHQIEGMVIDKGITMGDLKATLNLVVKQIYGEDTVTRFRPHHFPFTEPSCELDIQCHKCGGKGCPTCKGEGWIEILGAGMVHPKVLRNCGIDPDVYSGWAFGMGLERLALGEYKINDLRLIFENDVRLLEQF
jgi:phenylalanyl-tRNA synthetase alpha chain